MRDIGTFVWVVLVVIGVVSSIVSNARRRAGPPQGPVAARPLTPSTASSQATPRQRLPDAAPAQAAPQAGPPARVIRVRPPSPSAQPAPQADHGLEAFRPVRRRGPRLFGGRGALVRAVIGAEVLGKPLALRDE